MLLFFSTFVFSAVLDSIKHQQKSPVTLKQLKVCSFDKLELRHMTIPKYLTKVLQELYFRTPANIYTGTHSNFTQSWKAFFLNKIYAF